MEKKSAQKALREALWSAAARSLRRDSALCGKARAAVPQVKPQGVIMGLLFAVVSASAAIDPQEIDDVLNQTLARQEQMLAVTVNNPGNTGLWRTDKFAQAAYSLNTQNAEADAELIAAQTNGFYQTEIDDKRFHWHAYLQERIYFLFSSRSDFFPGRMSIDAENAVLEMLWDWASVRCELIMGDPAYIHYLGGSENIHLQKWVSYWGAAQIFAAHPLYSTYTYADGSSPAEMAAQFNEYFKAWLSNQCSMSARPDGGGFVARLFKV
jgi:hypothetical protein